MPNSRDSPLVGLSLGCGKALVETVVDELEAHDSPYDFLVLQATTLDPLNCETFDDIMQSFSPFLDGERDLL